MADYALSTWIVAKLPAQQALVTLAPAGFREVEISADRSPLGQAWEQDPRGVCESLAQAGMTTRSIHSPEAGRHLDVAAEAGRRASIEANVAYFPRMVDSGIPDIVIHATSSGGTSDREQWPAAQARAAESIAVLAELAAEAGVRLAVENIGTDPLRPGASIASLLAMIEGLGDHVGLCLDVGHAEMAHLDLVSQVQAAAPKLFSLHIHDVDPAGKDHYIPGEGRIDFGEFLGALDATGSRALRTLEISPPEADPAGRLRQVADVRAAWTAAGTG